MNYRGRITIDPQIRSGKPCIRGTRIAVADVFDYLGGRMTVEEILDDFSDLTTDDLQACFAFAADRERRLVVVPRTLFPEEVTPMLEIDEKEIAQLPITIDPEIVSGTPVFRGTRVPVDALINNLEAGLTLDEFLENFPTVAREQALQVLDFTKSTLLKLRQAA